MIRGKLLFECGTVHNPWQVRRLYLVIDDRPGHAKTCRFDLPRDSLFRIGRNIAQEFRDHSVKGGKLPAFIPALSNLLIVRPAKLVQGEIALRAADIPGQDHVLLPGFPRVVPAGFPRGEAAGCGVAASSKTPAASSTKNSF